MSETSFERDIRPLFRDDDVEAMLFAFDLSSWEEVREHAEEIHSRLVEGTMPCDAPWPPARYRRSASRRRLFVSVRVLCGFATSTAASTASGWSD